MAASLGKSFLNSSVCVLMGVSLKGYLPAPSSRRAATLARKRQEYADAVRLAFSRGTKSLDGPIWHQISIDVPRTNAGIRVWQCETTQRVSPRHVVRVAWRSELTRLQSLERILYVWAIRHPASGYVQGINDLVTPFFYVFLTSYIGACPLNTFESSSDMALCARMGARRFRYCRIAVKRATSDRSRFVLVPVETARRHSGQLYLRPAWHSTTGQADERAVHSSRRCGPLLCCRCGPMLTIGVQLRSRSIWKRTGSISFNLRSGG